MLNQSAFNDTFEFEDGALLMIGLNSFKNHRIRRKNSSRRSLKLYPNLEYMPIAIQRYATQYTIIPRGDTQFKEGDQVYFTTTQKGIDEIYKLTRKVRSRN